MVKHVAYFDRPAHYLRISMLFDSPFWGDKIPGSWFMSEAFGGCCVYNEGSRHDVGKYGVLNFLIAGSDALAFSNLTDKELIELALKSLPAELGDVRGHFLEGKTHRWLSSVNCIPGGLPVRDVMTNHRPEPKNHPGFVIVGDYLFDSTLNGLLDSSDAATDIIVTETMKLRRARAQDGKPVSDKIDRDYFENYRKQGPYREVWSRFTDPDYLIQTIKTVPGAGAVAVAMAVGLCLGLDRDHRVLRHVLALLHGAGADLRRRHHRGADGLPAGAAVGNRGLAAVWSRSAQISILSSANCRSTSWSSSA
jgi:hypothetical protein